MYININIYRHILSRQELLYPICCCWGFVFCFGFCFFVFFYAPGCDRTIFSCRFWWRGNHTKPRHSSLNTAAVSSDTEAAAAAAIEAVAGRGALLFLQTGLIEFKQQPLMLCCLWHKKQANSHHYSIQHVNMTGIHGAMLEQRLRHVVEHWVCWNVRNAADGGGEAEEGRWGGRDEGRGRGGGRERERRGRKHLSCSSGQWWSEGRWAFAIRDRLRTHGPSCPPPSLPPAPPLHPLTHVPPWEDEWKWLLRSQTVDTNSSV